MKNLSDNLDQVFDKLQNPERGIETGFFMLDEMLLGFKPSELIVVAGRPSIGKTSLMTDFILHAGKSTSVVVFSAEMSFQILAERMVANLANLNLHNLKKGGMTEKTTADIKVALTDLEKRQIIIDDKSYLTPLYIRNVLKQGICIETPQRFISAKTVPVGCVFIDYLQLLGADMGTGQSYEDTGNITKDLKAIAKELNVPVVLLSQLNRKPTEREGNEPKLSDLRNSGQIEEAADVVLLIHRPDYYNIKELDVDSQDTGEGFIIVGKNRNGPVGKVPVCWLSEWMSFRDSKERTF